MLLLASVLLLLTAAAFWLAFEVEHAGHTHQSRSPLISSEEARRHGKGSGGGRAGGRGKHSSSSPHIVSGATLEKVEEAIRFWANRTDQQVISLHCYMSSRPCQCVFYMKSVDVSLSVSFVVMISLSSCMRTPPSLKIDNQVET
jgi:hypothetical protein